MVKGETEKEFECKIHNDTSNLGLSRTFLIVIKLTA